MRRGARTSRPSPVPAIPAGTSRAAGGSWRKLHRPMTVPIELYRTLDRSPLNDAVTALVPASGALTLQLGPSGLGSRWYPSMAVVSTTTGVACTSVVSVYAGTLGVASAQAAQSYSGGGDTASLSGVELYPGLYVVAVWSGAQPGASATLIVYGEQIALV